MNKKCNIKYCIREVKAKGYCGKHYAYFKRCGKMVSKTRMSPNKIILYKDKAEIILTNNNCKERARTIIDLEDVAQIRKYKWSMCDGYIATYIKHKPIKLHRLIMNAKKREVIDHINRNPLDNRKNNLESTTQQKNSFNRGLSKTNKSGHTGVRYDLNRKKWVAYIMCNRKQIYLGRYSKYNAAVKQRQKAELKYFGKIINGGK